VADVVLGESKKFNTTGQLDHPDDAPYPYLVIVLMFVLPRNILNEIVSEVPLDMPPVLKVTSTLLEVDEGVIVTVAPVMLAKLVLPLVDV